MRLMSMENVFTPIKQAKKAKSDDLQKITHFQA